jgi:hypothetical protein
VSRSDRARNRRISASLPATPSAATDSGPRINSVEVELQSKLLDRDGGVTYVLVFDPGDEVISGPTLELILTETPVQLRRRFNPAADLTLVDL